MKTKPKKTILLILCAAVFVFASAVLIRTENGVDYTNPPPDHFVSPFDELGITWGPVTTIKAFFPAQANLQWLSGVSGYTHAVGGTGSMQTHPGASSVVGGALDCKGCHESNLNAGAFANSLVGSVAGVTGKNPYKDVEIQAAFDSSYLYVRASWQTQRPRPGITHSAARFNGSTWANVTKNKTSTQNTVAQLGTNEYYSYEDRFSIQMVPTNIGSQLKAFGNTGMSFNQAGCFIACHSSMRGMTAEPAPTTIASDPWLGTAGLNVSDIRHYLLHTRAVSAFADADATGNWQTNSSGYNLTQKTTDLQNGKFIDLWQLRGNRSAPMCQSSNDAILEYRNNGEAQTNTGENAWFDQVPATAQPANVNKLWYDATDHQWKDSSNADAIINVSGYRWMYDSIITGFHALPANAVNTTSGELEYTWTLNYPLITRGPDRNAVPLNMIKIDSSDLLPRNVLREATGIRGALNSFSKWDSTTGKWTVTFRRKLNTVACDHGTYGNWCSDHNITLADLLSSGQGLTLGLGIFDNYSTSRYHYITFPYTLRASNADITAYNNISTGIYAMDNPTPHSLAQNYPNPFNTATEIPFVLTKGENVKLEIYDISGHLVKTLVNGYRSAGNHTARWDAQNFSKGVYIYKFQAGNFVKTRQAVLK